MAAAAAAAATAATGTGAASRTAKLHVGHTRRDQCHAGPKSGLSMNTASILEFECLF
jgi:hypothetical protein